ncbi:MAG: hypothetical protein Q4D43_05795, partial [Clostridia bacterium]|nr:hypothetical protein [Clostridia bacterium]
MNNNRIETKNPRLLNLWGRGFVIYNTAVTGIKRTAFADNDIAGVFESVGAGGEGYERIALLEVCA